MNVGSFHGCCSAKILTGLGGSNAAEYGCRRLNDAQWEREVRRHIADAKERGNAVLCATTTTEQEQANRLLKMIGFKRTKNMDKKKHSETKLILWWLPLEEYINPNTPKRDAKGRFIKKENK